MQTSRIENAITEMVEVIDNLQHWLRELRQAIGDAVDEADRLDGYHPPSREDLRSVPEIVAFAGGGVAKSGDVPRFRVMGDHLSQLEDGMVVRLPNETRGGVDRYELRTNGVDWKYVYFGNDPWGEES